MRTDGMEELRPALIAAGFLNMPAMLFGFQLHPATVTCGILAAFAVYLADHRLPSRDPWTWPLLLLLSAATLLMAFFSAQLSFPGILFYILLACSYVLPLLPEGKRLQDLPQLRFVTIICGWAWIPLLLHPFPIHPSSLAYLCGMTGFMVPVLIWSDLADAGVDSRTCRETWISRFDERNRNRLLGVALFISLACFCLPGLRPMLPGPLLMLLGLPLLKKQPRHGDWFLLWPLLGSLVIQAVR